MWPQNRIGRALAPLGGLAQTAAMLPTIGDRVHTAAGSSSGQPTRSRFSPTFTCENGRPVTWHRKLTKMDQHALLPAATTVQLLGVTTLLSLHCKCYPAELHKRWRR